ncbi:hypothetical protein [Bdellovibrio sp.]|uniref:hypothetical protein n=1 Tax=Bdellovibrio sp. TaxID=28201 RepID=UPI00322198B0
MLSAETKKPPEGRLFFDRANFLVKIGRGCAKLVEPVGLVVSRTYEVAWKKQTLDMAELARLRFEEGLGSRKISVLMGIPRTTAITAVHRLEKQHGLR